LAALVAVVLLLTGACQAAVLEFTVLLAEAVGVMVEALLEAEALLQVVMDRVLPQPQTLVAAAAVGIAITAGALVVLEVLVLFASGGLNKELTCNTHSSKTILLKT
jgi:predicted anti-sigma-YlaC factor YlaD